MPEPAFNPERETREESVNLVAKSIFSSYEVCLICLGSRTPTLHRACIAHEAPDANGEDKVDVDERGVTGKGSRSVLSSSSSMPGETPNNNLAIASNSSSTQDAEAEDTRAEPEAEDTQDEPKAEDTQVALETEDPQNEPEASSKLNHRPDMMGSKASRDWLNHREPRFFQDAPDQVGITSGLGHYEMLRLMRLPEELEHDADDLVMIPQQVVPAAEGILMTSASIVTFQVPGFSMRQAHGIVAFPQERSFVDFEHFGLENLSIFRRP